MKDLAQAPSGADEGDRPVSRADLVREFLDNEQRTVALADEYAARLGMSRSSFYRLTKAFDATDALRARSDADVSRLDDRVERQISLVLDRVAADGRVADVHALVEVACRRLGLAPPARDVVRRRMLERLRTAGPKVDGPKLQFDETGLGMAVEHGGATTVPAMAMLLHAPTGRILAHRLDPSPVDRSDVALLDAFGLPLDTPLGGPRLKGGSAAAVFGSRLGPFLLRPRAAGRVPAKHYTFAVEVEPARALVGRLVDEHNATRPQI